MVRKKIIMVLTLCTLISGISVQAAHFTDVEKNAEIIENLYERGIIHGTSDTTFSPKANVTRAEFSKIVCRAMGYTDSEWINEFKDVAEDSEFLPYVNILAQKGIINGFEGYFRPNDFITNEEAAKVLVSLFESETEELQYQGVFASFMPDYYDISPWAREYVNKGAMIGAVRTLEYPVDMTASNPFDRTGVNNFMPQSYMLREDCAEVVYNVTNAIKKSNRFKEAE